MTKKRITDNTLILAETAALGAQEIKAKEIVRLDLRNIQSTIADYFVVCNADSRTQVRAIADSVEEEVFKATGEWPWRKEGFENGEWICLDYVNVVIHVFQTEKRSFYRIEDLWGDAQAFYYQSA